MPKQSKALLARFAELAKQGEAIPMRQQGSNTARADYQTFYAWAGSAEAAIRAAFGEASSHTKSFQRELSNISNNAVFREKLEATRGVFLGAKADIDGGHIYALGQAITSEVLGDFVSAAKAALADGHHTVAAVLACAALEDALKRFAAANGLSVDGKTMEEVVNSLKSSGLVGGAQKSLLGAMPKVRNQAMHAEWSKLTPQDAGSVLGFVEHFLLTYFP